MKTFLRCFLAVFVGFVAGSLVNMALVMAGPHLIPTPPGADVSTAEGMRASIHLFEPKHFLFPFLAHALGTFVGAAVAYRVAGVYHRAMAFTVGGLFLAGGIAASLMIPAPAWFMGLDLVAAYLPMAWLGCIVGRKLTKDTAVSQ